jgi:hypothetical protein
MFDLTSAGHPYPIGEITLDHGAHFNAKGNAVVADAIEKLWPQASAFNKRKLQEPSNSQGS